MARLRLPSLRPTFLTGLAALLCVAAPRLLVGDVVYLKSGKKVEGTAGEGKKPGTLEV